MAVAFNDRNGVRGSAQSSPDQLFATAVACHQRGQLSEAERLYRDILAQHPQHTDALHYAGVAALQQGRTDDGVGLIKRSLALRPDDIETNYHLGLALATSGRFEDAAAQNHKVIALAPGHVEAHLNLGNALKELGHFDDAANAYRQAILLNPDIAVIHYNLANLRVLQRDYESAFASYERALALQPNFPQALQNFGDALLQQGDSGSALAKFDAALALQPGFIEALLGRTAAQLRQGHSHDALSTVCRALDIRVTDDAKTLFVECLQAAGAAPQTSSFDRHLVAALREPWGWPREVSAAALATRKAAFDRLAVPISDDAVLTAQQLGALAADGVLTAALQTATINTVQLEAILTAARRTLLDLVLRATTPQDAALLSFACALAQQCFINEYVFTVSSDEESRAAELRDRLIAALDTGALADPFAVAVAAAYQPLSMLPSAERLLANASPAIEGLFTQQLREVETERQLRETLPAITPIEDAVSLAVQQQYEENPFPRWIGMPRPKGAMPLDLLLRRMLPRATLEAGGQEIDRDHCDVLVAGCGSGQEPIDIALRMSGAKILAVDLSRASLAYAMRKAREMGVTNVEFAQGDILKLHTLGRHFDYVTASGVMHHMADPFAAWRNLLSLVRPGGIMTVALYSEAARQHIVAARDFITRNNFAATVEGIRAARRAITALPDGAPAKRNAEIPDFFSTSDCRDLLFHVQELRLTIPQIARFMRESNVRFLGFRLGAGVTEHYLARFPDDATLTNLDNWHIFETEHPETFADMYQFVIQTAGAPASQAM